MFRSNFGQGYHRVPLSLSTLDKLTHSVYNFFFAYLPRGLRYMHTEVNITFRHTQRLYYYIHLYTHTPMQQILSYEIDLVISKKFITK